MALLLTPAAAAVMQRFLLHIEGEHDVVCEICDQPQFALFGDAWEIVPAPDEDGGTMVVVCAECQYQEMANAIDDLLPSQSAPKRI